ncbi:MAG TPA: Rne/Rng family ribonuclease [Xanthobacteraceae bacterium]|nr:Rne/Rng family ribonuclease [Xanthobacteraceae bacterium]
MANKMLIDAAHPEETRVVVLRGNRVEEFDFESAHRKQLRGNIYLAKVTRVEPSLQAAFVDYGGNRHGFLAFSEIHPDYYQIPVADRQALIDEEERAQRAADDEVDRRSRRHHRGPAAARRDEARRSEPAEAPAAETVAVEQSAPEPAETPPLIEDSDIVAEPAPAAEGETAEPTEPADVVLIPGDAALGDDAEPGDTGEATLPIEAAADDSGAEPGDGSETASAPPVEGEATTVSEVRARDNGEDEEAAEEVVESVGGADALEEVPVRPARYRRQYKIQEVIKRRQVMLVQVVKEERGTKGAALTTYLSLAGRYSVLMPNTARGGGISRKITNAEDRARLKEAAAELEVPEGMGVILRTAGASRTKIEIKRDFEYLLRMWETVRDLTLKSTAPKLVYEEGSLVKRSIRDLYTKDIDDVIVAGTEAYHEAKDFMRMLMPSHAKNVKLYSDTQPLLSRYGVENQLDAMFSPVMQLRSGGYIVLNQAEALVAIDVNSGRATREHHIEDTALKTNLEAADEIARQLRLRDLAGLIVIDFIDMDEKRNNRAVERRLKECLKHDRARIQVGRISHFGLLEMSRQRIRTGVLESSTEKCPHCGGTGHVRSVSSLALQLLRALEEQLIKGATHNLIARTRPDVALYVLNQKRAHLRDLEERFAITITISADEAVRAPQSFVIDRGEQVHTVEAAKALAERSQAAAAAPLEEEDELEEAGAAEGGDIEAAEAADIAAPEAVPGAAPEPGGEAGGSRRRRRRRRGGRGGRGEGLPGQRHERPGEYADQEAAAAPSGEEFAAAAGQETAVAEADELVEQPAQFAPQDEAGQPRRDGERRRRRGRRGGRRSRHRNGEAYADRGVQGQRHDFEPNDLDQPSSPEPALNDAVADLDTTPRAATEAPVSREAPPPAPPEEPVRRRSTVREPAPIGGGDTPPPPTQQPAAPAAEPVITESSEEAADKDRPRRTGWWARRFAGGG